VAEFNMNYISLIPFKVLYLQSTVSFDEVIHCITCVRESQEIFPYRDFGSVKGIVLRISNLRSHRSLPCLQSVRIRHKVRMLR
jgi:hypothetical protein